MKINIQKAKHSLVTGLIAGLIVLVAIIFIGGVSNPIAMLLPSMSLAAFVTIVSYFYEKI